MCFCAQLGATRPKKCVCVFVCFVCLGDRGLSTKVGGREEVTHASQGCDMPGSPQGSHWLSREHTLLFTPPFLCERVSRSDRHFKADGKQKRTQALGLPWLVLSGEQGLSGERVTGPRVARLQCGDSPFSLNAVQSGDCGGRDEDRLQRVVGRVNLQKKRRGGEETRHESEHRGKKNTQSKR